MNELVLDLCFQDFMSSLLFHEFFNVIHLGFNDLSFGCFSYATHHYWLNYGWINIDFMITRLLIQSFSISPRVS